MKHWISRTAQALRGMPDSARVFIDRQIDTWAKVTKDNGIKAD